jgi:hypothetical protein
MKDSHSSTVQILRLLRFAGLMALLGSVASAPAQTVKERLEKDSGFRVYPVIFGVTATSNSKPPAIRLVEVGTIKGAPKIDNVPDAFINAAKKKIRAHPPEREMKDGKPVEIFSYFFYVPGHPNVVVVDLDKPLDKQP